MTVKNEATTPKVCNDPVGITILRRKELEARTGLPCSTIYAKLRKNPRRPSDYDPTFPTPIKISGRSIGWIEAEVDGWIQEQIKKSRQTMGAV